MFKHRKNNQTTGSTSWSLHTSYTSLTGVHSEVYPAANARNTLIERKISDTMTTVESIHKKDLQSLAFRCKPVESSMLAYTERVKSISEKRPSHPLYVEKRQPSNNAGPQTEEHVQRKFSMTGTRQELFGKNGALPPITSSRKDNEAEKIKLPVINNTDSNVRSVHSFHDHSNHNRRVRRFSVYEKPELMDEDDKENQSSPEPNVSILPFPERSKSFLRTVAAENIDVDYVHSETPAPFIKPGYWSYRLHRNTKHIVQPILTREKKNPNGRRTKRGLRPIIKLPPKPYHQVFTYSSAIQTALQGIGDSDLVIDKKKNIFKSRAELESIDLDEVRLAHSLRSIPECAETELLQVY